MAWHARRIRRNADCIASSGGVEDYDGPLPGGLCPDTGSLSSWVQSVEDAQLGPTQWPPLRT